VIIIKAIEYGSCVLGDLCHTMQKNKGFLWATTLAHNLELEKIRQFRCNFKLGVISWRNLSHNLDLMHFPIGRNRNSTMLVWTLGICNHVIVMSKAKRKLEILNPKDIK